MTDRYQHLIRPDCPLPPGSHVIAYCRDSGGDEQDRSVQQQLEAIDEYAAAHQLVLERTYSDEARSGANSEKRGGIQELMRDMAARFGQIRDIAKRDRYMARHPFGLIVWKSNRLGRDSIDTTYNKADLRLRGITILNLVASLETGDHAVNAMLEMVQQIQDERLLIEIGENARRGLADLVGMRDTDPKFLKHNPGWQSTGGYIGLCPGARPVGFKGERMLVGIHQRKGMRGTERHYAQRLVPDPEVWDRCRLAWQMRIEGAGLQRIMDATKLYKTTSGYDHFFANRIYTGDLEYGGRLYTDFVPALIPRSWFDEEQARRAERAKKLAGLPVAPLMEPRRASSRFLLSGLVVCAEQDGEEHTVNGGFSPAGKPPSKKSQWDYYECTRRKSTRGQACQMKRISARALEQSVIDTLMQHVLTVDALRPLATAIAGTLIQRNSDVETRLNAARQRISDLDAAIGQLLNAIEAVGVSQSLRARLQTREAERRELEAELVRLEALIVPEAETKSVSEAQLAEWVQAIRFALEGEDVALAQQALRVFVQKIVLKNKKGTLYYTFPFAQDTLSRVSDPIGHAAVPTLYWIDFTIPRRKRPDNYQRAPGNAKSDALRRQVITLRDAGMTYPEIAAQLKIAVGTAWNASRK